LGDPARSLRSRQHSIALGVIRAHKPPHPQHALPQVTVLEEVTTKILYAFLI